MDMFSHKNVCYRHTNTIQVYSVTVLTHVKALKAGHSSQGTSEHITPGIIIHLGLRGPTPPGHLLHSR